jgi:hypothetical protein
MGALQHAALLQQLQVAAARDSRDAHRGAEIRDSGDGLGRHDLTNTAMPLRWYQDMLLHRWLALP